MSRRLDGLVGRRLASVVRQRMTSSPVVVLAGARTVGKSVLLRELAGEFDVAVVDLDDLDTRGLVAADPAIFVSGRSPVLIDEFQHVPELLDAIKAELNRRTEPGRYVITGSTRYDALPRSAQSLTGRATVVPVWPLSQGELDNRSESFVTRLLTEPDRLLAAQSAGRASESGGSEGRCSIWVHTLRASIRSIGSSPRRSTHSGASHRSGRPGRG